jgi:hypothetical protein
MNLVLQHWAGELNELCRLSSENIQRYAAEFGAEYRLLRGQVFRANLLPYCQKLIMLDVSFDEYDTVVMLDMDMFAPKEYRHDIFEQTGIGVEQVEVFRRLFNIGKASLGHPFWGGAIYRTDKATRVALRAGINDKDLDVYGHSLGMGVDEGIMHQLAIHAGIKPSAEVYLDQRWARSSFLHHTRDTGFIHIRRRQCVGNKKDKMIVHQRLVDEGAI